MNALRIPFPLFHWVPGLLELQPRARRYVCPFLVTLSIVALRLRGYRAGWYFCGETMRALCQKPGSRAMSEVACRFPRWMIAGECAFWNWRLRLLCRLGVNREGRL
jgi:hypothetical protein